MTTIKVRLRNTEERELKVSHNVSLMEAIRDAGIEDMRAMCGGCCSCATCHVYIVSSSAQLAPVNEMEDAMLSCSAYRKDNSRLACQVALSDADAELMVEMAPEE